MASTSYETQEPASLIGTSLIFAKAEGGPIHPDDSNHGYWGEDQAVRAKMLKAYNDFYGVETKSINA